MKLCLRHNLRMLHLPLLGGGGYHSPAHGRLLGEISRCPACQRRNRQPGDPVKVTLTFDCPEDLPPTEVAEQVETLLRQYDEDADVAVEVS